MYSKVQLPYEIQDFSDEQFGNLSPLLAHEYRQVQLFQNPGVDRVLKIYQKVLIGIFMQVSSKINHCFEYDSCLLIQKSLPLPSFRIPKNKSTKRVLLWKLVQTAIDTATQSAADGDGAKAYLSNMPMANGVLTLEAIQICFAKAKMLGSDEHQKPEKLE